MCHSPGCQNDGAAATFDCLAAVAPPGVAVVKGGCVSLCGAGPVVEVCDPVTAAAGTASPIKKKRVKGRDRIYRILSLVDECASTHDGGGEEGDLAPALKPYMRDRLMNGYELSLQANDAFGRKEYQSAVDLYTDAIESGRKAAMLLQEARSGRDEGDVTHHHRFPEGVRWLVTAFKQSCRARLVLKDVEGARRDAFAATIFSQNADGASHECLAEVCAASGDAWGELQAVKAAMAQYARTEEECAKPLPGADAPARAAAAKTRSFAAGRKRELGFRAASLESGL